VHWLTLLAADVEQTGSKAATARRIGISRTAVSLALAGKYPAEDTSRIEARVLAALAGRVPCPHDRTDIARSDCADRAARPMPMSSPTELRAWTACRACAHQPKETSDVV